MSDRSYQLRHGARIFNVVGHDDFLGRVLQRGAFYELGMLEYIRKACIPGLYLDVGAFIGTHTIFFAELCPRCTGVVAFEPMRTSFELLAANTAANCLRVPVELQLFAIGGEPGKCRMQHGPEDNMGMSCAKVDPGGDTEMTTIDAYAAMHSCSSIGLIKIDVEGHEVEAVQGAEKTIRTQRPQLFIECDSKPRLAKLTSTLAALDYDRRGVFNSTPTSHFSPRSTQHVRI
jgi:FkbM family methyltransferase